MKKVSFKASKVSKFSAEGIRKFLLFYRDPRATITAANTAPVAGRARRPVA